MKRPVTSDCLPSERAFYIQRSMLGSRLDAEYFQPKHYRLLGEMDASGSPVLPLRRVASRVVDGPFGSAIKAEDYTDQGVPFLRVADVTRGEGTIKTDGLAFISLQAHQRILRSRVLPGDVVVAKTGATMGAASLVPSSLPEANIRADLASVTLTEPMRAQYLVNFINTRMGHQLFWRLNSGATRGRVVIENLKEYPVVWPDDEVCRKVDLRVTQARQGKRKKESEAKKLLATVDDVLLDGLGIRRQPESINTLESRMFRLGFRQITGGRFDPIANQGERRRLVLAIQESRYPVAPLHRLVVASKSIVNSLIDGEPYVGLENIDGETGEFICTTEKETVGTATRFEPGQVLFPKLRPYLNKTHLAVFSGICSTEFHVFTPDGVRGDFLTAFLRSRAIVGITSLLMTGNTLPRLQMSDIGALPIPVPPSEYQEKICTRINAIKSKALVLREQARADLEQAKRDIEALILGKEVAA